MAKAARINWTAELRSIRNHGHGHCLEVEGREYAPGRASRCSFVDALEARTRLPREDIMDKLAKAALRAP